MRAIRCCLLFTVILTLAGVVPALAQGTTSSITGTVIDKVGVVPGAGVVVSNNAGVSLNTTTNAEGVFSVPALTPGFYTVTVAITGYKTSVTDTVRVVAGNPTTIKVTLEVGTVSETVVVSSSSELVNTQTATVSSTLNADQLNRMPTQTRNALNAVTFLVGINTTGVNRDSQINGLPQSMIYITLDGISNQDNFNKSSDGFFASVTPRQDAVEAVTVTLAVSGANLGGSGSATINFTTRSGTNAFSGSVYDYTRDPSLNTNYWFNERNSLPKNDVKLYQWGIRAGGPIVIPGVYDGRGKAFYFAHYEQVRFPNDFTRTRTTYHPDTLNGDFRYLDGTVIRSVNLMALAAANGQIATYDPEVKKLLGLIQDATAKSGTVSATANPLLNSYVWLSPGRLFEHQPTVRLDYNIGTQHRLSGSYQVISATRDPDYLNGADSAFPGGPNYRVFSSVRPLWSFTLRSTMSTNLVNEARVGLTATSGASKFGQPSDPSQGPGSFADIGGYAVVIPLATDWWVVNAPSWRAAPTISVEDSVSLLRGKHAFNVGGMFLTSSAWENAQNMVPGITLGFSATNDPAAFMFTTANFPGGASALGNARSVYAMLTGRVSAVTGQAALDPATNEYVFLGPRRREGKVDTYSLYGQDSWRLTPMFTLNLGVRWDLQLPFTPINDTMSAVTFASVCGMSGPGDGSTYNKCDFASRNNVGVKPEFVPLSKGTKGYEIDWNNVAPSINAAWRPNVQGGWLRAILGDPELATLRGGYSESYERQGLGVFTGLYGGNPGATLALSRNATSGDLVPAGESWPVLYSEKNRLYPAAFPVTPTYPIQPRAGRADSISAFAPDTQIASARSWVVSFQRSITKDTAVDIRYVGNHGLNQWSGLNYNTRDLEGNGFTDEFKLAVNNLKANNAAGGTRAGSFAYFGAGTGTSPLPIYLAYLNRSLDTANAAAYSGTNWKNTSLTQDMIFVNPSPANSAGDLDGDSTLRANAEGLGYPRNFFVLNPDVNGVNVTDSGAYSEYDALQIDVRRRLSNGLSASINYQLASEGGSAFLGFKYGRVMNPSATILHAIKMTWDWTIPVGRGQRFGANMNPVLDAVAGGWSFRGVGRVQAQLVNFGNVRLVGMSKQDLQKMYKFDIRIDPASGLKTVYMLPDAVIQNTRRAFSLDPTSLSGYGSLGSPTDQYIAPANSADCMQLKAGDCAPRTLLMLAPWFTRFDVGLSKKFRTGGSTNIEFAFEVLNLFDSVNFNSVANPGSGATIFQTTSAYRDPNNSYDPGGRLGQIMLRFSW